MKKLGKGAFILFGLFLLTLVVIWLVETTKADFIWYILFTLFMFATPILMSDGIGYVKGITEVSTYGIDNRDIRYDPLRLFFATVEAFGFVWLIIPAAIIISPPIIMYFGWLFLFLALIVIISDRKHFLNIGWSKKKYNLVHFTVMTSLNVIAVGVRVLLEFTVLAEN